MKKMLLAFCVMALGVVVYESVRYWKRMTRGSGPHDRVATDFNSIYSAVKMFEVNTGRMPTQAEGLAVLMRRPAGWPEEKRWWRLMDRVPLDPWGREYRYTVDIVNGSERMKIRSAGPDGVFGTRDDREVER